MKIFNIVVGAILCALPVATHATEDCPYFSPAIALCSVHSYNIGDATNPTDVGRATEMNDIIALKTTVMVQQLKQQYDDLNAVIKRFKTQLEKAVLTSKIEVLTGNTSSSSGSSSGSNRSYTNGLSNAEDCGIISDQADVYNCLTRNIAKINQAAEKDPTAARKQLTNDLRTATDFGVCDTTNAQGQTTQQQDCNQLTNCTNTANAKGILNCTRTFNAKVISAKNIFENSRNQYRRN